MAKTDDSARNTETAPKKGKKGLIITCCLALVMTAGGFFATYSGLLDGVLSKAMAKGMDSPDLPDGDITAKAPVFLELDPMMISVGGAGSIRQLRFRAFLQVAENATAIAPLQPRILDIFATYLRAVSVDRLEDPTALLQLRAQLLRRVQLLAGPDAVQDLLIIDFVIT